MSDPELEKAFEEVAEDMRQPVPRTIYRAVARRGPEAWLVEVPEFNLNTTARRIDQVADRAGEAICYMKDVSGVQWGFGIEMEMADQYTSLPGTPAAVVCDIDGTLALHNNRGPFEFDKVETDDLNLGVFQFLEMYANRGRVILLSGRQEEYRAHTARWLEKHFIYYDELHMRATGDRRSDDLVKAELFDEHIRNRYTVTHVLDDRDRCVFLWRKLGLPCWQVAEGNF